MSDHPSLAKVTKCLQPDFSLSTFSLLCFSLSALIEEVVGWGWGLGGEHVRGHPRQWPGQVSIAVDRRQTLIVRTEHIQTIARVD